MMVMFIEPQLFLLFGINPCYTRHKGGMLLNPWKHRLDPKSDIIFKRLFRDKQILIPFLNDTLHLNGLDRIVDVTLLETTKEREHPEDKQMNYAVQRLEEIS